MQKLRGKLTYANVVATLALVIAVAGGSTAIAVSAAKKSADVTPKGKIRAGRVTTTKLADAAVTQAKIADASVSQTKLSALHIVNASGSGGATATCPPGERLVSGGGESPVALVNSFPNGNNGWAVANTGGQPAAAFAVCLQ